MNPQRLPRGGEESEPERIGVSLARVVRQLGWAPNTAGVSVIADWERIVGPSIAANARAVASEGTTLVVSVDDPAWATQLHWLESDLLARLAAETGVHFERLAIRVRPRPGRR